MSVKCVTDELEAGRSGEIQSETSFDALSIFLPEHPGAAAGSTGEPTSDRRQRSIDVAAMLRQAEETVGHIERWAGEAAVRLEQAARTTSEIEHELASLQQQLQTLTESARHNVERRARHQPPGDRTAAAGAASRRAQNTRQPVRFWAVLGALLAVLVLLGSILMRSRDQPVTQARTTRAAQQASPSSAPASAPPGRTPGIATSAPGASRPAATITMPTTSEAASDARPAKHQVRPARHAELAKTVAPPFVGTLMVASEPAGAAVFVDRQDIGKTPLQVTRLRAGSHVVRIEQAGYERWTSAVLVPADKRTRVSAQLQPIRDR